MAKLRCPKCGTGMNRHAEKVVHPQNAAEAGRVEPAFGGLLEETHACPGCGNLETRRL